MLMENTHSPQHMFFRMNRRQLEKAVNTSCRHTSRLPKERRSKPHDYLCIFLAQDNTGMDETYTERYREIKVGVLRRRPSIYLSIYISRGAVNEQERMTKRDRPIASNASSSEVSPNLLTSSPYLSLPNWVPVYPPTYLWNNRACAFHD